MRDCRRPRYVVVVGVVGVVGCPRQVPDQARHAEAARRRLDDGAAPLLCEKSLQRAAPLFYVRRSCLETREIKKPRNQARPPSATLLSSSSSSSSTFTGRRDTSCVVDKRQTQTQKRELRERRQASKHHGSPAPEIPATPPDPCLPLLRSWRTRRRRCCGSRSKQPQSTLSLRRRRCLLLAAACVGLLAKAEPCWRVCYVCGASS
jgi:hypothetical protein